MPVVPDPINRLTEREIAMYFKIIILKRTSLCFAGGVLAND